MNARVSNDAPGEPTTPLPPNAGQWPAQPDGQPIGQPGVQPLRQHQNPYPPPYPAPGGYYGQQPGAPYPPPTQPYPTSDPTGDRSSQAKVPAWTWPAVAMVALVVGLGGGALAGALVANEGSGPGEVLRVERRTAPPLPSLATSAPASAP